MADDAGVFEGGAEMRVRTYPITVWRGECTHRQYLLLHSSCSKRRVKICDYVQGSIVALCLLFCSN